MLDLTITPAPATEAEAVLRILFQQAPREEQSARLAQTQSLLAKEELDGEGLLIAQCQGRLVGVILANLAPGAAGMVWPPQVVEGVPKEVIEDALLTAAKKWLRDERGAKMAQALLPPEDASRGPALERNGFPHLTSLSFLRRSLNGLATNCSPKTNLHFDGYGPETRRSFETILLQTYEGTQDCPELNGVRTIDEILAGHQAQGCYDPSRWWLVSAAEKPVGVLLTNVIAEWNSWEIIYMGVVPNARGQGIGHQLVLKALSEARRAGVEQVTLSVDERNVFARRIYSRLGFVEWGRREVYLAVFRKS